MKLIRKLTIFPLLILLLLPLILECSCSKLWDEDRIIQEMILSYGFYRERAAAQISFLLEELEDQDPPKAQMWREIMEDWQYTDTALEINYDLLPNGLDTTDGLCIVVLGYQLNPNGSIQEELEGRLKTALACANQYPNAILLCTGGGTAVNNPDVTEAGQMADWLIHHGLNSDRILVEDSSRTTAQNAEYSYRLLQEKHPEVSSLAIVTSDYHIPWGMILFLAKLKIAEQEDSVQLQLIAHAAYNAVAHKNYSFLNQAAGLLELAGYEHEAFAAYYGMARPPRLQIKEPKINRR